MTKRKTLEIYIGLPNGSAMTISRRSTNGAWWLEIKQPRSPLTPVLLDVRDFEAADWFDELLRILRAQGHDPFPSELYEALDEAANNPVNNRLRVEREQWFERARAIKFQAADGELVTLSDAMSVWFWKDSAEICFDPISAFGGQFMDATGRTVEQVAELRREVELIARGLRWEISCSEFDLKRITYINEHARWAEWRDVLVS